MGYRIITFVILINLFLSCDTRKDCALEDYVDSSHIIDTPNHNWFNYYIDSNRFFVSTVVNSNLGRSDGVYISSEINKFKTGNYSFDFKPRCERHFTEGRKIAFDFQLNRYFFVLEVVTDLQYGTLLKIYPDDGGWNSEVGKIRYLFIRLQNNPTRHVAIFKFNNYSEPITHFDTSYQLINNFEFDGKVLNEVYYIDLGGNIADTKNVFNKIWFHKYYGFLKGETYNNETWSLKISQ